jgi:hypothetical protein
MIDRAECATAIEGEAEERAEDQVNAMSGLDQNGMPSLGGTPSKSQPSPKNLAGNNSLSARALYLCSSVFMM